MLGLEKVTQAIFEATTEEWNSTLDGLSDIDPVGYITELGRLEDAVNGGGDDDGHVYALVDSGTQTPVAQAILQIVHVQHGKDAPRMKVLNLRPHPRFDFEGHDTIDDDFLKEFSHVVSKSIVEALGLTFQEHPANELKLYGRTEQMYGLFQGLATHIADNGGIDHLKVSCHSKWLVFKKEGALVV